MTPPGGMSPSMGHPNHPMGGIHGMPGMGQGVSRRPGDPMHMSHGQPPYGMIPPPPHDLGYGLHSSQQYRGQGSPQMYHDSVPGGPPGGSRNSSGQLWPSLDTTKREPKSPRMEANSGSGAHPSNLRVPGGPPAPPSQNGGSGMRNGASGGYSNFSIPSPNFGPGPGLPPIGRPGQGSQGGSNPTSASQTPLLNPSLPPTGSMLPPPTGSIYNHGHSASHGGSHSHAHSGSYFDGGWPRSQQSPSSSSLNLNGPSGNSSTSGGPPSSERQTPTSSRNRSDSLGGAASSASSGPGQWSI